MIQKADNQELFFTFYKEKLTFSLGKFLFVKSVIPSL